MTYPETLQWMYAQLPMYQRVGQTAYKKDLSNILAFTKVLNNPHLKFKSIHVGGTNGKGSTSHMLASILQEAGYKVGLYTSPHLKDFRERIKINGTCISKRKVSSFITKHQVFLEQQGLSFFEMTVGLAFHHFAQQKVDVAVVEVGLGGRLDSTNILIPELSIITNIGYDHTAMLGNTLPKIAYEKAGIIKENVPVVVGEYQEVVNEVFEQKAKDQKTRITYGSDYTGKIPYYELRGNYQFYNVKTVLQSINTLKEIGWEITSKHVKTGLKKVVQNTGILGRWQVLQENPTLVCDTAHNREGLQHTLQQISEQKFDQLHIVLGVVNDKNLTDILPLLPTSAIYYFCKPNVPRGLSCLELQQKAHNYKLYGKCYSSVKQALKKAKKNAQHHDFIYVGGSTFVVAEVV
jgi:dihydrofolate synthase/folylpolyglutamate synthase